VSVATQSLLMAGSVTGVVCLAMMKRRTSVSNEWVTERLAMGHPASMSQHVKRMRKEPKTARQLKKHEQALKSEDLPRLKKAPARDVRVLESNWP
jgi:hypothetical protein